MKKLRQSLLFTTVTFLTLVNTISNKSVVYGATIDQLSPGPNNTVIDSDQNLKWLKLDQSLSINLEEVINKSLEEIPSNLYPGFRLATYTEVTRLVSNLTDNDADQFINLFGVTDNSPPFPESGIDSEGWFLSPDNIVDVSGGAFKSDDGLVKWVDAPVLDVLYKSKANKGIYLVAVPENSSIFSILVFGSLGIISILNNSNKKS